jgi:pimeloyl-ACP methyl ester carboxylesterase
MENFLTIPWARLFVLLTLIYLIIAVLTWFYGDRILFPAPVRSTYSKNDVSFFISLENGQQIACMREGNSKDPINTIIFSHGNGEDLGNLETFLAYWGSESVEIISYDYPGYGLSEGKSSEEGCFNAIEAVYQKTVDEFGRNPNNIVLWGRSLGTGPSLYLSNNKKVGGIILETPFLSAFRSVTGITILPWDRFRNIEFTSQVACPSLVIHGTMDEVVPFSQGKRIFKALPAPKEFLEIPDAEHNNIMEIGGDFYDRKISDFLISIGS